MPQGSHKNQESPIIKNQAKNCTIARHLDLKNLTSTKLGFLINWGHQKEIFIWEWANTLKYDSICSKEPQGSIHKFTIAPESAFPKIRN